MSEFRPPRKAAVGATAYVCDDDRWYVFDGDDWIDSPSDLPRTPSVTWRPSANDGTTP